MKSASDPRHQIRRKILQQLFATSYDLKESENIELSESTKKILEKLPELNRIIEKAAPEWPIDKINKVDLAILRLAIWELIEAKTPQKAVIDEAIELAKEFGSEASPSFVNGVLGTVINNLK
jgi:transcription antitermination protein NusB